jgi:hypothetical protein
MALDVHFMVAILVLVQQQQQPHGDATPWPPQPQCATAHWLWRCMRSNNGQRQDGCPNWLLPRSTALSTATTECSLLCALSTSHPVRHRNHTEHRAPSVRFRVYTECHVGRTTAVLRPGCTQLPAWCFGARAARRPARRGHEQQMA